MPLVSVRVRSRRVIEVRMDNARPSRETSVKERKHAPATTTIIQRKGTTEPDVYPRLQPRGPSRR